jgi:hypothetical protein
VSLTATYIDDRGRVRLEGSSLGASATYAVFDRTINGGITYTTVRGASEVPVSSEAAVCDDHEFTANTAVTYRVRSYNASDVLQETFTATVTVNLDVVWIKVPAAPVLNRVVTVTEVGEVTRKARGAVFDVVSRRNPVSVSAVRSSRALSVEVMTTGEAEANNFDLLLQAGEPILLHVPAGFPVPSLYASVGDVTIVEPARGDPTRLFTLPLTEVDAPDASVIGSTYVIQNVIADYATISDMIADNDTIYDLLQRVGDPEDVVVD